MEAKEISKKEDNNDLETFEEKELKFMERIPRYCRRIILVIFVGLVVTSFFYLDGFDLEYFNLRLVFLLGGSLGGVGVGYVIGRVLCRRYLKLQASNKSLITYSVVHVVVLMLVIIGVLSGLFLAKVIYAMQYYNVTYFVYDVPYVVYNVPFVVVVMVLVVVVVFGGVLGGIFGGLLGGLLGGILGGILGGVGAHGVLLLLQVLGTIVIFREINFVLLLLPVGILVFGVVLMLIRAKTLGYKGLIGHTNMSTSIRMGVQLGTMLTSISVLCIFAWGVFALYIMMGI